MDNFEQYLENPPEAENVEVAKIDALNQIIDLIIDANRKLALILDQKGFVQNAEDSAPELVEITDKSKEENKNGN